MQRILPPFAVLLALAAAPVWAEEMNIADLPAEKPADTTPRLAYGQVVKYGDRIMFAPCRDRSFIQIDDTSAGQQVLAALDRIGLAAGRKLYVELFGYVEGGALKATRLNLAQADGRCQVPGSDGEAWRASGSDPGWLFAAGGEWVQFKRQGQPELVFPYVPFQREAAAMTFASQSAGHALAVRFAPQLCHDPLAEAVFAWTATLTLDGQTYQGCAWER